MAYNRRKYRSTSSSASRRRVGGPRKTTKRNVRAARQQPHVIKLVIEQTPGSAVARPELAGLKETKKGRAKF